MKHKKKNLGSKQTISGKEAKFVDNSGPVLSQAKKPKKRGK